MSAVDHQINYTITSTSGVTSLSGYENESGNTEVILGPLGFAANSTNTAFTLSLTAANLQSVFLISDKGGTIKTNGNNTADVQTITMTGGPTGGTFPIVYNGAVATVAFNATNATIQTALQALTTIGTNGITCSGGPVNGTPVVCTFAGSMNTGWKPLMTTTNGALTGGTNATATITHTTPGAPTTTIILAPGIPLVWGTSAGYGTNPFTNGNVTNASFTCTSASRLQGRILSS